jgi:RimJ/RimL family protein N-acetyltransferase
MSPLRLRRATFEDARDVFEWANDPVTRAQSFQSGDIPWPSHVEWMRGRLSAEDVGFYIGVDADTGASVGMVRVEPRGGETVISLNVAPGFRGRGLAAPLIEEGVEAYRREHPPVDIVAYIKPTNLLSIRSFTRAGFLQGGSPDPDVVRLVRPA